jgi:hypothetical protein
MRLRTFLAIVLPFWAFVAASNILHAHSFGGGLAAMTNAQVFAAPGPRVLQHVLLLPALIACYWASLRLGWAPWWRAGALQTLLGVVFAALATPMLLLAERLLTPDAWQYRAGTSGSHLIDAAEYGSWLSSATNFLLTYGSGLALVTGFALYRRSRDSELQIAALERAVSATRLAALRMQLSPHTLFNLLHTIRGQIGFDSRAAQTMIVQLADLLRRLLVAGERDLSSLADELQLVRVHLELQQQRFADRLRVSLPESTAVPDVWVPTLILYPLAENAIVHGLGGHEGEVQVHVEVASDGDTLTLRVRNTLPRGREGNAEGIGLSNLRERLALQFGGRVTCTVGPTGAGEWLAEIRMPHLPLRSGCR